MIRLSRAIRFGVLMGVAGAAIGAPAAMAASGSATSPLTGHPYRHGMVLLRPGRNHRGSNPSPRGNRGAHGANRASANSPSDLNFGGGLQGVGVTTGAPRVYLVFYGSQWGSQGTNAKGYATFSGDPVGMAPDLQAFFTGLGTGSETWSGVMTQYCEGVATGVQSCPASASHVGYPSGGALAGVWADESSAAPSAASGHQLAVEAVNAANHFGNTTTLANRNVQYVIVSPTGTNPDNYFNHYCAWHDYTGDSTLSFGGGASTGWGSPVAFTNLPYVTDMGLSCGQDFVNSGTAGTLDGVTIVEGHEYAETITDQFPAGGWTDNSGNENGDKCAWISFGQGAAQNISLTTGTFAVQSTWANDFNTGAGGCEVSHPIVTSGPSVTVTNPGNQVGTAGTAVNLQMSATDSDGPDTLTYSATGLPAGLSISSSGDITGTPTTNGTSTVTVTASDALASGSTSFSWTIGPDFTISASPTSASVRRGSSASFTINTTQIGNTTRTINLSEKGQPSGVNASLSSSSVASGGHVTLTLTATSSAPTGTFKVTVTGSDASGSQTTSVSFTVRRR
jgi:serine protease